MNYGQKNAIVKTYMAHHQGLILLSINNLLNNHVLQKRFMKNPEMQTIDILLQERMPNNVVLTKQKKEKIEKLKYKDLEQYTERIFNKMNTTINNCNVISNDNYTIVLKENGEGYSQYNDILINRFKETDDYSQGIFLYLKNIKSRKTWKVVPENKIGKCNIYFMPDMTKFIRKDDNIKTTLKIYNAPSDAVEIRQIELENEGNTEEIIEVSSLFEPVLSSKRQEYAHPAFNNLFLKYEYLKDSNTLIVKRNSRNDDKTLYLATNLYTENETIGDIEFEIDKQKLLGRGNLGIPRLIKNSIPFSNELGVVTDPVVALRRTIKIQPGQKSKLSLILAVGYDGKEVEKNILKYKNLENIERTLALSKARVEEENRYLGIKGKDIEKYQKILALLLFQNPLKSLYLDNENKKQYKQSDLWQYGISGDIPMLVVTIKDINDIYVIEDLLKAYEYINVKNIKFDLIILNEEDNIYEKYVKEAIEREIQNRQLSYLINRGIYLLNISEIKDKDLFITCSNLVIHANDGDIETALKYIEADYKEKCGVVNKSTEKQIVNYEKSKMSINFQTDDLKYYNEYGGFSSDGKEYKIRVNRNNRLPTVWSHVLANPNFGTVITENMGGFTWSKNSRLNRITSWSNNPVMDINSEIFYLKDCISQNAWSLGLNPMPDDNDYLVTYGFGYAKYQHNSDGLIQEMDIFVPREDKAKVHIIKIKNIEPQKRKLKLLYYIKPVLGEDDLDSNSFIDLNFNQDNNCIYIKNMYAESSEMSYICCSEKINSFTGRKQFFIGNGGIENPDALKMSELNNESSYGQSPCVAIQIDIELDKYESKEIVIVLGSEEKESEIIKMCNKYSKVSISKQELSDTRISWYEKINKIQVRTPIESINIMLNGWATYQTIACRLWARSAFYQSGGAYGFRDQLQDTLGLKYVNPYFMKNQIIKHTAHQFIEGDVEHWWHDETRKGIRTKFSDDLLWLPYIVAEYLELTQDNTILDMQVNYISGNILDKDNDENYDTHPTIDINESVLKHCIRAINKAINLGEHGIPKIGSGDWNDGFSTIGNKGRGESVWLGFFLYDVLQKFIPICENNGAEKETEKWKEIMKILKNNLNTNCWDGRWYRRAFTDSGKWIGSSENEEAKIDSIAQSWSIISNAGDNDKKYICMESLDNYLVDRENEIIKLLTPAFEKSDLNPGYIQAYLPGVRENGGQYTHAALWAIWAITLLGFGDKAIEYYKFVNPIEHARTIEAAKKYKVEPYVICADMYGGNNLAGRGGWTWYTGSSSWFNKIGLESILGLKVQNGKLKLEPCIPSSWKEYSIKYQYKNSTYNIKVKNFNNKNTGISKFIFNGKEIAEKEIVIQDNYKMNEIEIEM